MQKDAQAGGAENYDVPLTEALELLEVIPDYDPGDGPQPCVHTFAQSAIGLLGAHWSLDSLRELMWEHGVQRSGDMATRNGHGLVVVRPKPRGPLFIATKAPVPS